MAHEWWCANSYSTAGWARQLDCNVTHTADFNGDGKADILFRNDDGSIALWLMNGTTLTTSAALLGAGSGRSATHVADFNGDGKAAILFRHTDGRVAMWLMNGLTLTGGAGIIEANSGWNVTATGDFNGDGKADLVWRHTDGRTAMWLMDGLTLSSGAGLLADPNWTATQVGDFSGDGKTDILWRNTDGSATIWLMNGINFIGSGSIFGADPNLVITHVGDYNGDGKADIVWHSASNGIITMGLMNGAALASLTRIKDVGIWGQTPWVVLPSSITLPPATSLASGFSDPGFMRGAMRTEYEQGHGAVNSGLTLLYGNSGAEGCLWDATDILNSWGCAGRAPPAGPRIDPWRGVMQNRDACGLSAALAPGARVGNSWTSCFSYLQSNLFAINWTQNSDYWVIVANSDPSFDLCNLGPPSLSWPVVDPINNAFAQGYFKVGSEQVAGTSRRRAQMIINADDVTHRCQNDPSKELFYTIPFLSIGAQQNKGQSKPVAYITNPPYSRYHSVDNIRFDATVYRYDKLDCRSGTSPICNTPLSDGTLGNKPGAHAGMYITAQWGGKNRQIFLDYFGEGSLELGAAPQTRHWNWPIAESFLYPGAEIVFLDSMSLQSYCGITFPTLMLPTPPTDPSTRRTTRYSFNASEVFACASRLGRFETPMPLNADIPLVGVHWYVETVGTKGGLWIAIENTTTN